jgi:ABC-2 type transport system ATP-binding protein
MTDALVLADLHKRYADKRAVDGLSFTAPEGQITGVLGPNGAGKSTTLRMIVGILRPDAGTVSLFGEAPTRKALQRVGYLPEERGLYRNMTARGFVAYLARLKGMPGRKAFKRADALLEQQGLRDYAHKKVKTMSKGMAQKVQIAAAIAHAPDLVVFDEPFSGLDPVNQATVENLIRAQANEKRTVLFSTHIMEHAERICDRIVMIANGKKAFEGSVDEALALAPRAVIIETEAGYDLAAALAKHGLVAERTGEGAAGVRWRVVLAAGVDSRRVLSACVAEGAPLTHFEPQRATLHQAFVQLVGETAGVHSLSPPPRWQ